jgi:DNA polymerase (family 10)
LATIRGDAAEQALFARAVAVVRRRGIESDADLGPLLNNPPPDVEADVLTRLQQMFQSAAWVLLESSIADLPADLRWLFESGAVTMEQLAALHGALGVTSAADLGAAVHDRAVRAVTGLDEAVEEAIGQALPALRAAIPRIALGRAMGIAEPILDRLRALSGVQWALPAGSLRRGQETVGDIELVAATVDPSSAIEDLSHLPEVVRLLHRSPQRVYLLLDRVQVGVRLPEPENAGAILLHATGSIGHLAGLRAHAAEMGWRLTGDGLYALDATPHPSPTEEEFYSTLNLPFIPAEIRNGDDEIAVAKQGTLPTLLTRGDIRGDLHMHSVWSDGRDSVEAMVQMCRSLGHEYIAITDHSPHSAAARNLSVDGVARQGEEIARLREQYPDITILHGCEVDILPDGRLDFPDRVLERLDIVLASLHERAGQTGDHLLRRYMSAMKHPLVSIITHPTNRLVPNRRGYDLDYDRLFETAVESGTLVEIDGSPVHLDLDGPLARRAVAAGATLVVNSDCHRAEMLDRQMQMGIVTARRGWVEARHVANTRPLADIQALIAAKRKR